MGILDDYTWVIWQTYDGKWHSSGEGGYLCKYADAMARSHAKALAGDSDGTASFIGTAKVAYCIHARNRYQALKMAKGKESQREYISLVTKCIVKGGCRCIVDYLKRQLMD